MVLLLKYIYKCCWSWRRSWSQTENAESEPKLFIFNIDYDDVDVEDVSNEDDDTVVTVAFKKTAM